MEEKNAVKKAKKNYVVIAQQVVGCLLLVAGALMVIEGFKHQEVLAGAVGAFAGSAVMFGFRYVTMAALIYIDKNE